MGATMSRLRTSRARVAVFAAAIASAWLLARRRKALPGLLASSSRGESNYGRLDDCKPVEHSNSAKTPPVSVSSQPQDDTEELESAEMLRIGSATRQSNGFALSNDERGSSVVAPMSPVLVGVGITAAAMVVATIASRN